MTQIGAAATAHEFVVDVGAPYDLPRSLAPLQRGYADPSIRLDEHTPHSTGGATPGAGGWLCQRIYTGTGNHVGAVTIRLDQLDHSPVRVRVAATSEAAAEATQHRIPHLVGAQDDWSAVVDQLRDISQGHGISGTAATGLLDIRRRNPGVRLPATGALFDQLVVAVLEQKVTHQQARHSWRTLLRWHGERPPSAPNLPAPDWMRLPLTAQQLRGVPSWQWHKMWVQPPLAATIQRVAERASAVHRFSANTPAHSAEHAAETAHRLSAIPGIGQWTTAEALQRSHASADLPSVGDYHLAHYVGQVLTGRRTDDDGMLKLLEPFRPHRQRVVRLIKLSGTAMERFGPKLSPEDHRSR